jgi:error-prone DNA polymerase
MHYIELHCHSYFSLFDATSSPEQLVQRAAMLGYPALALTDHDAVYSTAFDGTLLKKGTDKQSGKALTSLP